MTDTTRPTASCALLKASPSAAVEQQQRQGGAGEPGWGCAGGQHGTGISMRAPPLRTCRRRSGLLLLRLLLLGLLLLGGSRGRGRCRCCCRCRLGGGGSGSGSGSWPRRPAADECSALQGSNQLIDLGDGRLQLAGRRRHRVAGRRRRAGTTLVKGETTCKFIAMQCAFSAGDREPLLPMPTMPPDQAPKRHLPAPAAPSASVIAAGQPTRPFSALQTLSTAGRSN